MDASKPGCPAPDIDDERSSCCLLANVEKLRLPEGFAFAAPEPSLIESCMTLGAFSRTFFSSSRIYSVLSVADPPCAIHEPIVPPVLVFPGQDPVPRCQ